MKQPPVYLVTAFLCLQLFTAGSSLGQAPTKTSAMKLNNQEYLEYLGVNVMLAHDFYPES